MTPNEGERKNVVKKIVHELATPLPRDRRGGTDIGPAHL
jgi:hypothetical protein